MSETAQIAKRMRLRALEMAYKSGQNGAHLGGGLSAIEILATLYHVWIHAIRAMRTETG